MIVERPAAGKILRKKKSQIRTPVLQDRQFGFAKPCTYRPGERYPIHVMHTYRDQDRDRELARLWFEQPYGRWEATQLLLKIEGSIRARSELPQRGYVTHGYVLVTAVHKEDSIEEISPADVLAMGYRSREQLLQDWRAKYGDKAAVWAVEFEPTEAPDLFLQARVGEPHGDYTTSPSQAIEDAGVVPDAAALEHAAEIARERHTEHKELAAAEREQTLTIGQRIDETRAAARARGVDVSDELKIIGRQLAKMDRAAGRAA